MMIKKLLVQEMSINAHLVSMIEECLERIYEGTDLYMMQNIVKDSFRACECCGGYDSLETLEEMMKINLQQMKKIKEKNNGSEEILGNG